LDQDSAALFSLRIRRSRHVWQQPKADGAEVTGLECLATVTSERDTHREYIHYHVYRMIPEPAAFWLAASVGISQTTATAGGATRLVQTGANEPPRPGDGTSGRCLRVFAEAAETPGGNPKELVAVPWATPQAWTARYVRCGQGLGMHRRCLRATLPHRPTINDY